MRWIDPALASFSTLMAAPAVSVAASAALLSAPPAASVAAPDAALLCTQCFWQPRLAAADGRCAECQQWRVELNVGGIPGRSVVARKDIAEGSCILTEAPDQFYCILDPQATASSSAAADGVHRASTALGAYEQVLRQVATAYLADAPHGHVREIIDGLHCVDERTFLLHHLPRDPPEVIGLLRLAKQLHREFTRERSNPELQPESLLQLTESQFVSWVIKLRLNAWFLVSVPPMRLVLSTLIAAFNFPMPSLCRRDECTLCDRSRQVSRSSSVTSRFRCCAT